MLARGSMLPGLDSEACSLEHALQLMECAGGAPALAAFQEAILRRLLLADAGRDLVELAADALLPLLLAHPADFKALGECALGFRV